MHRSRTPSSARALIAGLAALALIASMTACDSGTQEPEAPAAPEPERAMPSDSAGGSSGSARPEPPRDGSIAPERFPESLADGITAEIPDNMPTSIPIYPGAQPAQGRGGSREGVELAGVQLLSNDPVEDVFAYYESELKANGWDIVEAETNDGIAQINATNGSARAGVFITVSPMGGTDIFVLSEN